MTDTIQDYKFFRDMEVRFADLDAIGHLNHAKYLTYMEQSRIHYLQTVCGWSGEWENLGMILAKATVDYLLPVHFGELIRVYIRCSKLGHKSFNLSYLLKKANSDSIVAQATTVMVAYDYQNQQTIPVPTAWKEAISEYEIAGENLL